MWVATLARKTGSRYFPSSARPLPRLNLEQLNFAAVPRTKPSLTDFRDFVGCPIPSRLCVKVEWTCSNFLPPAFLDSCLEWCVQKLTSCFLRTIPLSHISLD